MAPTLRTLLAVFLGVSLVGAMPTPPSLTPTQPSPPMDQIAAENTGPSALPTPTTAPLVVALGLGTQNYTCTSASTWTQAGAGGGANALLYNVTDFLALAPSEIKTLPAQALAVQQQFGNWNVNQQYLLLGHHFFSSTGTPSFDLFNAKPAPLFLSAKKLGDVKSPVATAVDWLYLVDNGSGATVGLSSVYRLETAGGVAPAGACTPGSSKQVEYAAEYWFYD